MMKFVINKVRLLLSATAFFKINSTISRVINFSRNLNGLLLQLPATTVKVIHVQQSGVISDKIIRVSAKTGEKMHGKNLLCQQLFMLANGAYNIVLIKKHSTAPFNLERKLDAIINYSGRKITPTMN
jgi:hypothetical protein